MGEASRVVAIGASAGGLEALTGLFGALPGDTGLTFVVVTHLAAGRQSALTEILGRSTTIPVSTAADRAELQGDRIFVMAPDTRLAVEDGHLRVLGVTGHERVPHPIDQFFGSVAEAYGEKAVGIVLSGSGTDGTLGVKAIKEHGGLTIAQGPDHGPRHTGMPHSAIDSGLVEMVLPIDRIAQVLALLSKDGAALREALANENGTPLNTDAAMTSRAAIQKVLRERVGHDFSGYKATNFMRRVDRRMQVLQLDSIDAYLQRLRDDPDEVPHLFRALLIGVTDFFRDADAFAALERQVLPKLFEGKRKTDSVRVWVPGCATGEEAYSLAMLLREAADALEEPPELKVFASDINEAALEVARLGQYPRALLGGVSEARRARHFDEDGGFFRIRQRVRELCIFSSHSLIRDPPFSRIDLVSCRNLLIYLSGDLQRDIIPIFHYALRPKGFLFLGGNENLSRNADLFSVLDKKHRIFQRRDHVAVPRHFPAFNLRRRQPPGGTLAGPGSVASGSSLRQLAEGRVLERFAPAHVLVNAEGEIVHFSPGTGDFLEAPGGNPTRNLTALGRKGLALDLRAALHQAMETHRLVRRERVNMEIGRGIQLVDIVVEPLPGSEDEQLYLVIFERNGPPVGRDELTGDGSPQDVEPTIQRLERDLSDTRERLQAAIEEYETGTEELKSSNEELVSLNEELQSTNEELETNKEELQSTNEELSVLNAQLARNAEQLNQVNADLRNIFDSTEIALVFLDSHLMVRSFTAPAAALFKLIRSDEGRPLSDIAHHVDDPDFEKALHAALDEQVITEKRISLHDDGEHFLLRILPYRGGAGIERGVLVTMVNIDSQVAAEQRQSLAIEALSARLRQQAEVAEFGAEALRSSDLDALLHQACVRVAAGLNIELAKVLELLPESEELLVRAGFGWDPDVVGRARIGAGQGSSPGLAMQTGEPVVSEDMTQETRFEVPELLRQHGVVSSINVIIRTERQPFGVLEADSRSLRHFGQDDVNFLQSCANLVAAAVDRLRASAELRRALDEKQVLLYELQHRVKNSLQEVSALVGIERRKVTDPELRQPLDVLQSRLEALGIVYRRLYLADSYAEIELSGYLAELVGELMTFHGDGSDAISHDLDLVELHVGLDVALPLALIVCEFVVNSFRHAFPARRGRIAIRLEASDPASGRLTLADDGIGLPRDTAGGNGWGLRLIARLVDQIGGSLETSGEKGMRMTVTFPRVKARGPSGTVRGSG